MIRKAYDLTPFHASIFTEDENEVREEKYWAWSQLLGEETDKGDTMEFTWLWRGDGELYAAILRDADRKVKFVIPLAYTQSRDSAEDVLDYSGTLEHCENMNEGKPVFTTVTNSGIDLETVADAFLDGKTEHPIPPFQEIISSRECTKAAIISGHPPALPDGRANFGAFHHMPF